jgi:hypothetical protein
MSESSQDQLGPTGHLTPEQLDEVATQASADVDPDQAGIADGPGPVLADHLSGCAQCRTALGDQIAVQGWLRRVPGPGPMPSDVVTRLDAALAAARRDDSPSGTVLPMRTESARASRLGRLVESRVTKSLVAAAAVVLIGVGGYAAINHTSSTSGSAGSSAGSAASAPGQQPAAGNAKSAFDAAAAAVRASGTAYTKANLTAEVTKQLTGATPAAQPTAPQAGTDSEGAQPALRTPAGLHACLAALGDSAATPLLVDLATYNDQPVAVIVLPGNADGRQIWVVARTCTTGADGVVDYKLLP